MGWPDDGVAAFFLVCFFIGLLFTVISFFLGVGHSPGGAHAGHGGGHHDGLHLGHLPLSGSGHHMHVEAGHAGGGPGHAGAAASHGVTLGHGAAAAEASAAKVAVSSAGDAPSPLNLSTVMAFLTWFGGAGYILRSYYGAWLLVALAVGGLAGLVGAALVFTFLRRVLYASQRVLDPNDYYLPGTLARVTSAIRAGGIGEIIFTKDQTRQVAGARSVDGQPVPRGADVVIMRYVRGLAYVQRWDELMGADEAQPDTPSTLDGH